MPPGAARRKGNAPEVATGFSFQWKQKPSDGTAWSRLFRWPDFQPQCCICPRLRAAGQAEWRPPPDSPARVGVAEATRRVLSTCRAPLHKELAPTAYSYGSPALFVRDRLRLAANLQSKALAAQTGF